MNWATVIDSSKFPPLEDMVRAALYRGACGDARDTLSRYSSVQQVLEDIGQGISLSEVADMVFWYVENVLGTRWPEVEPLLLLQACPTVLSAYCSSMFSGVRWPEAEPVLLEKYPEGVVWYALDNIRGRWPEGEPHILQAPAWLCHRYIVQILHRRWPEAEPILSKFPLLWNSYVLYLADLGIREPDLELMDEAF